MIKNLVCGTVYRTCYVSAIGRRRHLTQQLADF